MARLVDLDALPLSRAILSREVSCREVMVAYLDRIEAINPRFNAVVSLRDRDELLREADERDAQLARGEVLGWMHGMPQAVKDLAFTRGLRTTQGSPLFADQVPQVDALIVDRVRRAGAIVIGKTNVPEFGLGSQTYNPVFGATRNAYDPGLCAGGSSGGAAVALALRLLPVADGSDMGGSLRNPAAFNNVLGFRPSTGLVPKYPAIESFMNQLGIEGPMGRTVADVARLLATQAGADPRVPNSLDVDPRVFAAPLERDLRGARVGWLGDLDGHLPIEEGILTLASDALRALADIGCVIEPVSLGFEPARLWDCWLRLRNSIMSGTLGELYRDPVKRARIKPEAIWEIESGLNTSMQQVHQASVTRTQWHQRVVGLFSDYDYLALPTAQVFPFDVDTHWPKTVAGRTMDTYHRWMEIVVPWTLAGCPVLNVPVGFDATGRPMGMQLIGPPRGDLKVLQLGLAYERATRWVQRRPPAAALEP